VTEPAAGAGGRPTDLLFCRGCGGSVPRREFLAGRALLLEGRAWCAACVPGTLARRRFVRACLWAGALAGIATVALLLRSVLRASLDADGTARRAAETAELSRGAAAEAAGRLARLDAEIRGLSALVESEGRAVESLKRDAGAREGIEDRLEGVERSLAVLLENVEGLRKEAAALRPAAGLAPEEEEELLARLDDANAGVRFESLWRLRRGSGASARKAAVKGLADPEDSVRYQAALLARDLKVKEAVPALVERLADGSVAVRSAAIDALRTLEGTDLGYEALEPVEGKREEAVRLWRKRLEER